MSMGSFGLKVSPMRADAPQRTGATLRQGDHEPYGKVYNERAQLIVLLNRLIAEVPERFSSSARTLQDRFNRLLAYIKDVGLFRDQASADVQAALRRASQAEIALEAARTSCSCGAVEHEIAGAAKLFERLEGTVADEAGRVETAKQKELERARLELQRVQQAMSVGPPTARGVRIMYQEGRAYGRTAEFEAAMREIFERNLPDLHDALSELYQKFDEVEY